MAWSASRSVIPGLSKMGCNIDDDGDKPRDLQAIDTNSSANCPHPSTARQRRRVDGRTQVTYRRKGGGSGLQSCVCMCCCALNGNRTAARDRTCAV